LYASAQSGHTKVVELLMHLGANVNIVAKVGSNHAKVHCLMYLSLQDGWTCLHVAAQNGHKEVVEALINSEADVHAISEVRTLPL